MSAQIIGNLTGAILISKSFGPSFFYTISVIEIVALFLFLFVPNPKPFDIVDKLEEPEKVDTESFLFKLSRTFRLLFTAKMFPMNFTILWNGIGIAVWSSILTPIMTDIQLVGS